MDYENEKNFPNKDFFENLNIAKEFKYDKRYIDLYQGQFPVAYIDFIIIEIGVKFENKDFIS